jgi:16S rRNA (cytidine1402-2'-O)-methyltransferase
VVSAGRLYVLSTPIGHLGDFSFRGLEVLRAVAVVAAEDTRRTRRLLAHYAVEQALVSLHAHSRPAALERLLDRVEAGEDVAYVTDAGTPGVADPGAALAARAHERGITVVPVPGAAAVLAALAASGFPADRFVFVGFLPRKGAGRQALLARLAAEPWTSVCYEAPLRTAALLDDLAAGCGPERPAAVARELTKLHEEVRRGTVGALARYYREHPPRGEITVVVGGAPRAPEGPAAPPPPPDPAEVRALVAELRAQGGAPAAIAKELARRLGIPRHDAYRLLTG